MALFAVGECTFLLAPQMRIGGSDADGRNFFSRLGVASDAGHAEDLVGYDRRRAIEGAAFRPILQTGRLNRRLLRALTGALPATQCHDRKPEQCTEHPRATFR